MKVKDLKEINDRYYFGRSKDGSYFKIVSFNEGENNNLIRWSKVNGDWGILTDVHGKYQLGSVKIDIIDVFTYNEGHYLSGGY